MSNKTSPSRLKLRLTPAAEKAVRGGHPWVYAERIKSQNRDGQLGEMAVIYDRNNEFMAIGLFDPESPIRVRVLHAGEPQTANEVWWQNRLAEPVNRRLGMFSTETTGYRVISGENDGWPGLVLDRFADTLVLKLYSGIWLSRLPEIVAQLQTLMQPERIVLRLSRNIQTLALEQFGRTDGSILFGPDLQGQLVFQENGIQFESDVLKGQKTGFFLISARTGNVWVNWPLEKLS